MTPSENFVSIRVCHKHSLQTQILKLENSFILAIFFFPKHSGITIELTVACSKHRDGVYVHSTEWDSKFLWSLSIN